MIPTNCFCIYLQYQGTNGYLISDTPNLHRYCSRHHTLKARSRSDFVQMVIDWECARYTKPDKPLNARQTMNQIYPQMIDNVEPILKELGL